MQRIELDFVRRRPASRWAGRVLLAVALGVAGEMGFTYVQLEREVNTNETIVARAASSNARKSYQDSLAEHWAVAVAIRNRDPDAAEQAMRTLLSGTARDLAPAYEGLKQGKAPARGR